MVNIFKAGYMKKKNNDVRGSETHLRFVIVTVTVTVNCRLLE
jgi:hypothetical protein